MYLYDFTMTQVNTAAQLYNAKAPDWARVTLHNLRWEPGLELNNRKQHLAVGVHVANAHLSHSHVSDADNWYWIKELVAHMFLQNPDGRVRLWCYNVNGLGDWLVNHCEIRKKILDDYPADGTP